MSIEKLLRRSMLTWVNHEHDVRVGDNGGDWVDATAERLAKRDNVGTNLFVLGRHHVASAAKAGLNLIGDHEHVVLGTQLAHALQVAVARQHNASLALNRLEHNGGNGRVRKLALQHTRVIVRHNADTVHVRAKASTALWISRGRHGGHRTAVKVLRGKNDLGSTI